MSAWHWLARTEDRPTGALGCAELYDNDDRQVGFLAAWHQDDEHAADAVKVDSRAVAHDGPPGWASIVMTRPGTAIAFDDAAVSAALRHALRLPWPDVCSTLVSNGTTFAGALTATARPDSRDRLCADPFARVLPRELVRIGPGLLGHTPAPVGPGIQRHGSGRPWPWDRFDSGMR
ncbi:MAG: hypothetical protein H0W70_03115 [Actinobacteria bacterium]|nr:hypothetical protein [Actinomycetota bacterium]